MKIKFHFSALTLILTFGAAHAGEKTTGHIIPVNWRLQQHSAVKMVVKMCLVLTG
ncbi:hypothetical protein LL974_16910 [Xanthomonas campestris pv. cannae]|nr:hypothetical protein [Xanthomonas campestris pv. cannae]